MKLRWIALGALILGLAPAMNAQFNQCPASPKTDFDGFTYGGCLSLITANADGTFTIKQDTSQPNNDAGHGELGDALIGFQNNSGAPIGAIRISGCESSVDFTACFAFDTSNPAVKNNVFGTKIVADAAVEAGVDAFVMVSTDKAASLISFGLRP